MMAFTFLKQAQQNKSHQPRNRIRLLSLIAAFTLAGCAMPDTAQDPAAPRALLQRWSDLTGAQSGKSPLGPPGTSHITLRRPSSVSARNNEVYLIDAGLNRIFQYNRFQQTLIPFTNLSVNADMRIYAAPDRSVYIADPHNSAVLHFTVDGTQLPSLVSPGNLARPVAVSVDERNGQILVADALFDQFVFFNSLGMTLSVVRPQHALAIAAMTTGPDGIYVADRIDRQVSVLGWDGAFRYAIGAKDLGRPGAIAVNRDNLVFVGDNSDQTIKVYRGQGASGEKNPLMAKIGGPGAGPGSFNGISDLAVDGSMLYATDSLNARVQILLINQ
jgi:hypothetical protein